MTIDYRKTKHFSLNQCGIFNYELRIQIDWLKFSNSQTASKSNELFKNYDLFSNNFRSYAVEM